MGEERFYFLITAGQASLAFLRIRDHFIHFPLGLMAQFPSTLLGYLNIPSHLRFLTDTRVPQSVTPRKERFRVSDMSPPPGVHSQDPKPTQRFRLSLRLSGSRNGSDEGIY